MGRWEITVTRSKLCLVNIENIREEECAKSAKNINDSFEYIFVIEASDLTKKIEKQNPSIFLSSKLNNGISDKDSHVLNPTQKDDRKEIVFYGRDESLSKIKDTLFLKENPILIETLSCKDKNGIKP